MKRKNVAALLLTGTLLLGCGAGAYASFVDSVAVDSHISMGLVDIDLSEYEKDANGNTVIYTNDKTVVPGENISKIPRITNKGENCYIRAKITYEGASDGLDGFSDNDVSGINEDWIKIGDYYYYKKILTQKESVDLFTNVTIPASWTEAHSDQSLGLTIQADAIQAVNFKPDYSAMSPWGNQTIELAMAEEDGEVTETQKNVKLSVEFNGKAHKLIAAPKDFFSNFGKAMPGDVLSDSVNLSNTTDKTAELFFRTDLKNQNADQLDLLDKLQLTISMNGKELYSGNMRADSLNSYISLGKYKKGEAGKLDFTVSVPKELGNAYALKDADVRWIFTVREQTDKDTSGKKNNNPADNSGGSSYDGSGGGAAVEHGGSSSTAPVKTGDDTPILPIALAFGVSGIAVTGIALKKKRTKQ